MSDQCRHCQAVGKWEECQATACFQHENWYAEQFRTRITELEVRLKEAETVSKRFRYGLADAGAVVNRQIGQIAFLTERCEALEEMAVKNGWIQTVRMTGNVRSYDDEVSEEEVVPQ